MAKDFPDFIIIGGGLIGLSLSIHLSTKGFSVEIYEKYDVEEFNEGYSLGISTRGLKVLETVLPEFKFSKPKEQLEIYRGKRRLASFKTGNKVLDLLEMLLKSKDIYS